MSAITTERRDQVLVVHLDDGKANALSFDMIDGILTAIHEAENDDQIGAVVVHGREGKFSAGFDLGVMMADDQSAIVNLVANGGELVRTLYGCSVPVVAASTGHALAAGALMLLGCDVRIGADVPAKVGLNEVAIKMVLPDWALTIAGARLSKRHMQRSIVNARITTPADAVDVEEGKMADLVANRPAWRWGGPLPVLGRQRCDDSIEGVLFGDIGRRRHAGRGRAFRQETLDEMDTHIAAARASIT